MSTEELQAVDVAVAPAESAAPTAGASTAAPAAPLQSPAQEWAQLPKMFGSIVSAFPPLGELRDVYTDANCQAWGDAMAPIAAARGWTAAAALAWLGPWVQLGMASHALLTPTVLAIARVVRAAKAARAAAAAAEKQPDKGADQTAA